MRKLLSILLAFGLLLPTVPAFGESTRTTHYRLDTGVVFAWANSQGIWQGGKAPGTDCSGSTTLELTPPGPTETIENVTVKPYSLNSFPDDYNFNNNPVFHWNSTAYAYDQISYREFYLHNSLLRLQATGNPSFDAKSNKVNFSWKGTIGSSNPEPINVKEFLGNGQVNDIYAMMGYTPETAPAAIKTAMEELYPSAGQSPNVQGFLYFVPYIIQYDVVPAGLLPPKVLIDCKATSMFIGLTTPVKGAVQNRNTVPVITRYRLTASDTLLKSGTALQEAGKSLKVESTYTIPAATKPGKLFTFRLWAEQTAAFSAPDRYLPREEGEPQEENPAYTAFVATHTYVPQAGAWYKNDAPWLPGQAECRKTAVLQPEAPLDHRLNPAVIVE